MIYLRDLSIWRLHRLQRETILAKNQELRDNMMCTIYRLKSLIYILSNASIVRIIRTFKKINNPGRFCQWWELHNKWRRDRDSNPGDPFGAYTLSRRAPSTARPSLPLNHSSKKTKGECDSPSVRKNGGDERDRTADLLIANETLSQLSYIPTSITLPCAAFL